MNNLHYLAAETTADAGLFGALGIDWRLLVLQLVAFLLLVFLLGKFVYPWLMKQVDERQANIEAAQKAATEAQKAAADNREKVAELLDAARKEAADIVATAKLEAEEMHRSSEAKAKKTAERIVNDAHEQIDKDVAAAQKALYNETIELVALATEKIVGAELSSKVDNQRIAKTLQEIR
ncbi:ATP synthase F0 subunit B [Candidatus Saccharibacteria bacterium]|nr:ATP synthase F0 subunit B [Candidatus Saccharibacteria bacterium]|tara:strand:+ start:2920 stop:3456 length:537 start_codon:yes stop_codon:yes gene_type:complete